MMKRHVVGIPPKPYGYNKDGGIAESRAIDAESKLFANDYDNSLQLIGITIQELKEYAGIEGAFARELMNRLKEKMVS